MEFVMEYRVADRTQSFQESVIRKMTRVCLQFNGINLAQGFPEKSPPEEVLLEALQAIRRGNNQYSITWGLPALREAVENVHVEADIEDYIAALVHATRSDRRVAVGASPRGSLAFLKLARANAALEGRDYVIPDDVKRYAVAILTHRLILQPEYWMSQSVNGEVIHDVLAKTPVPVIS